MSLPPVMVVSLGISRGLLTALVSVADSGDATRPFFSNDLVGFLKVVGVFGSMLAVIISLVVKLAQSKYVDQIKTLTDALALHTVATKKDVDGLGDRLNTMSANCTRVDEAERLLELNVARHTQEHNAMSGTLGELRASVAEHGRQMDGLGRDNLLAITEAGKAHAAELTAVRVDIARLQERDRLGETLARLAHMAERRANREPGG
jgi:hypothetical protein